MEFKSQICTTKEQSERLLELGLKKETADMALVENWDWNEEDGKFFTGEYFERPIDYVEGLRDKWIPAWSLHRLMEIVMKGDKLGCITHNIHQNNVSTYYELVIASIEHLIKIDEFNKDYLEEKK